ncbi:hypothetical protein ACHAPU_010332 [Fusarium lateritium]
MADKEPQAVQVTQHPDSITTITISCPRRKNAVDNPTARKLADAFLALESDTTQRVCGAHGTFCTGFYLHEVAKHNPSRRTEQYQDPAVEAGQDAQDRAMGAMGPRGCSAVSGHAVAGGLELSLLGDIRIVEENAIFGVFCRRFGVPLIGGGTVRPQANIGLGRALDMVLTGRAVTAQEALQFGLANRVVPEGQALTEATKIAKQLLTFSQECMNIDRTSCDYPAYSATSFQDALRNEYENDVKVVTTESVKSAIEFSRGVGRHGVFDPAKR